SKGVVGDEPAFGTALHPEGITTLVVENTVSCNGNPVRAMENDARIGYHHVRAVDDIPANHDIVVTAFSADRRPLALFDHIAGYRVSGGSRRIQMNPHTQGPGHGLDAGDHVSRNHCAAGTSVKQQDTLADGLQHRTSHNRTIGAAHLKT